MNWNGTDPYYVLSLDGGGIWAVIQAMALRRIYGKDTAGHDILRRFNLVAANSGGSIVLAALAANLTPAQICNRFTTPGNPSKIFSPIPVIGAIDRMLTFGPKYSTIKKRQGLQDFLPEADGPFTKIWAKTGSGPHPDILISAFDYDSCRATFFRSNLQSKAASSPMQQEVDLLDAVNASSTAPVNYFDQPAVIGNNRYWDGGVGGYNNPILAAIVEALANGVLSEQIRALSIGTGEVFLPIQDERKSIDPNLCKPRYLASNPIAQEFHDLKELAESILDDPPDAASFEAFVALGQPLPEPGEVSTGGRLVRMNPLIQPIYDPQSQQWSSPEGYDPATTFAQLANTPMDAAKPREVDRIVKFCEHWLAGSDENPSIVNQPLRANRQTLQVEIGHRWFSQALTAWQTLQP